MTNMDNINYMSKIEDVRNLTRQASALTALQDADTVLADLLMEDFCPEDCQDMSIQLFSIFEAAKDDIERARLSELFSVFTGVSFDEYLKRAKAALTESLNTAFNASKTNTEL